MVTKIYEKILLMIIANNHQIFMRKAKQQIKNC